MTTSAPLSLFNSLTRQIEDFVPQHEGQASVYSCGPTVYNYQHIGNMRAYVFADTLGRVLSYKDYQLNHVINITDVGHLTSDADAGDDKMEKAAAAAGKTARDIADFYQADFEADLARLNIRKPQHPKATDYVPAMIDWAKAIADKHCYELESGLYFDTSTVPEYGRLARDDIFLNAVAEVTAKLRVAALTPLQATQNLKLASELLVSVLRNQIKLKALEKYTKLLKIWEPTQMLEGQALLEALPAVLLQTKSLIHEHRIQPVDGKRNEEDFAIWRKTPPSETRQMEWESPWGRGAPGWHLECSVMSQQLLGHPFDIHTGGIDHREIHHPNEIAQNQAHGGCDHSGATIWMHNNFLIDRRGKMSKSTGEFLRLQTLVDRGFHPLAYRLMCLQAHYRSEMEFTWEGLAAARTRLKRMAAAAAQIEDKGDPEIVKDPSLIELIGKFNEAISDDLNTPLALTILDQVIDKKYVEYGELLSAMGIFDKVLGLEIGWLQRIDLRIRPITATITEAEIEAALAQRKDARAAKDFATSDAIRDELIAKGVEVMDGDPLGWDWRLEV